MKFLGCAYYPEYWGARRVETDAQLMADAGINLARIGEFAWTKMEPAEGVFTLDWLHNAVDALAAHGIQTLLCTPTPTPPAWLTTAYPDTLVVRADGTRARHGTRRHYCPTSDTYRRHSGRIAAKLGEEFGKLGAIAGWQIDNELGPEFSFCHCENCQSQFRVWLQARYGDLDTLNDAWRTDFWSMRFTEWGQIRLAHGDMYSSMGLDTKRFHSHTMIDYALAQASILRETSPGKVVTTNGMGPMYTSLDYHKLFEPLDYSCDDLYFDISTMDCNVAAMSIHRNIKPGKPYWITETGSGALDHNKPPHPDQFRAWMWSAFAHGSDAHLVFRWRTCLSGQEQELQGILEHSGLPGKRYAAVQRAFKEVIQAREALAGLPLPKADVAILYDYDNVWAYEASRVSADLKYDHEVLRIHREFYRRRVAVDIASTNRDLSGYKVVILPNLMIVPPELPATLQCFVESGGIVLATGQLGLRDTNDNYLDGRGPDRLQELFGINIDGGMYLASHVGPDEALWMPSANRTNTTIAISGDGNATAIAGSATVWAADISVADADVVATFTADQYMAQAAITQRKTGTGHAVYLATAKPDEDLLGSMIDWVFAKAGIDAPRQEPEHVEAIQRGDALFVINHRAESVALHVDGIGDIDMPAYGVRVYRGGNRVV